MVPATVRKLAHNFIVGTRLETFRHFLFPFNGCLCLLPFFDPASEEGPLIRASLLRTNTLFVTPHLPYSPQFLTYPHTSDPDVYIWQFWRLPMIFCLWNALLKKNYWVVFPIISRCVHYLPLLLRSWEAGRFSICWLSLFSRHFFFKIADWDMV